MNNSNTYIWPVAILDADFAIKVGRIKKYNILEDILPNYIGKLLIHEYVYENEVLSPRGAKNQIDALIQKSRAEIVNEETIAKMGKLALTIYENTIEKLRRVKNTRENGNHWGEIVSIAFAQTVNIPYFLSDETGQQSFINENFSSPIQVVRIEDLVRTIKETGGKRKDALLIWTIAGYGKERFNDDLWPLE
ncbi:MULTISPECIES: hypothetical protein [Bacillaceae]|jgi:hypothetical protein|uniref:PIN domain-containing protein n=2 Tax=Bacillaceae TaxID=186817 RepID=A0A0D0EZB4_9BACI|nr:MULTISPECIES: hypothetical protein [Bacillaceae]NWN98746.1 hypothetical protein [Bacillus sp. (in: firmicutes)]AWI13272.1 hypothetical protein CQJ30_14655 [Caldibacillus thermoamylovorans]KIO65149.1 hypothetical protein B4065_1093 [Caldibacillus thermoamylovorans]KIO74044.1 hypothetical protein B4167_1588 [Caldibacillus thermoamylovorans]MBU5342879.1 hypothetical protein [Caldifermentibacillus hisashii]